MRRFTIGSAMVLALLLMFTAIATAAPPDFCDPDFPETYKPNHPSCDTTTTTTTVPEPSTLEPCQAEFDIEVLKPGRVGYECLWTPVQPELIPTEGVEGIVTVTPTEGVSSLVVFVRDDAPGDICLLAQGAEDQTGTDGSFVGSFDLSYYDPVPDGYDAWAGTTYWDLMYESEYVPGPPIVGAYWCGPQDPVLETIRFDTNGTPLHLSVGFKAKKNTGPVAVTLSVGQKIPEG